MINRVLTSSYRDCFTSSFSGFWTVFIFLFPLELFNSIVASVKLKRNNVNDTYHQRLFLVLVLVNIHITLTLHHA